MHSKIFSLAGTVDSLKSSVKADYIIYPVLTLYFKYAISIFWDTTMLSHLADFCIVRWN